MNKDMISILVVDDDETDREAIHRSFKKHRIANPLVFAKNAVEAWDVLKSTPSSSIDSPYMILLDLKMPGLSGIEFLHKIRDDEDLKKSIVFILTTSDDQKDRLEAYDKNVAGYILKSNAGRDFIDLLKMLDLYWKMVEFPTI